MGFRCDLELAMADLIITTPYFLIVNPQRYTQYVSPSANNNPPPHYPVFTTKTPINETNPATLETGPGTRPEICYHITSSTKRLEVAGSKIWPAYHPVSVLDSEICGVGDVRRLCITVSHKVGLLHQAGLGFTPVC